MVGNLKKKNEQLITVQEGIELSCNYTTSESLVISHEYIEAFQNSEYKPLFEYMELEALCSIMFNSGRIQGIREERKRRNK